MPTSRLACCGSTSTSVHVWPVAWKGRGASGAYYVGVADCRGAADSWEQDAPLWPQPGDVPKGGWWDSDLVALTGSAFRALAQRGRQLSD